MGCCDDDVMSARDDEGAGAVDDDDDATRAGNEGAAESLCVGRRTPCAIAASTALVTLAGKIVPGVSLSFAPDVCTGLAADDGVAAIDGAPVSVVGGNARRFPPAVDDWPLALFV